MRDLCLLFLLFPYTCLGLLGLDNGLGRTPQMGWNSWNHFHCNINQSVIMDTADAFISSGLNKFGYVYVNVYDCWAQSRDSKGVVQPDPDNFTDFQGMIDHVHSRGSSLACTVMRGPRRVQEGQDPSGTRLQMLIRMPCGRWTTSSMTTATTMASVLRPAIPQCEML